MWLAGLYRPKSNNKYFKIQIIICLAHLSLLILFKLSPPRLYTFTYKCIFCRFHSLLAVSRIFITSKRLCAKWVIHNKNTEAMKLMHPKKFVCVNSMETLHFTVTQKGRDTSTKKSSFCCCKIMLHNTI